MSNIMGMYLTLNLWHIKHSDKTECNVVCGIGVGKAC